MKIIVTKFGGTSMGTAKSIQAVAKVIKENDDKGKKIITVVSACSGSTDLLITMGEQAFKNNDWKINFQKFTQKHEKIVRNLGIKNETELKLKDFEKQIQNLLEGIEMIGELSLSTNDRLMSFGEKISSNILSVYLNKLGLNAKDFNAFDIIFTDNDFGEGKINFEKTNKNVSNELTNLVNKGCVPVVTGFLAQSASAHYITLGRGGSDYTAAIIAAAVNAQELQIWTDVDGILNVDPRLCPEAKVLKQLSFYEAGELAYFGAKVLHPKTIKPAISKNIPVRILNTFNTSAQGTIITNKITESIKSVTYKKGIKIINICSAELLEAHGFLAKIFEVFGKYDVVVDVVSTSEVSVSVTVDKTVQKELIDELNQFSSVNILENMAIVCLVGEGIKGNAKILEDLFGCLNGFEVSMVSQGASKRNVTFLVEEEHINEVVKSIYEKFFK